RGWGGGLTRRGGFVLVWCGPVARARVVALERRGSGPASRNSTSRASFAQRLAGTAQCAAAGALGAAAIAFGWHLVSLTFGDPGYKLDNRYVAQFAISPAGLRDANSRPVSAVRLREIIESIPGVLAVAFGTAVPGEPEGRCLRQIPDPIDPPEELAIRGAMIDSRDIETLGLTLIQGRAPEGSENDVVLLNQSLARAWWGREDVVG